MNTSTSCVVRPSAVALVLLSLLAATVPAQAATTQEQHRSAVTVTLRDRESAPIEGVLVQLLGPTRAVIAVEVSGGDGVAILPAVPHGTYELRLSSVLYTDVFRVVEVGEEELSLDFTLRPTGVEERVTVTASRGALQQESKVPATILALDQIELRGRAVDLLPRMLDEEPGILAQQTTPGQGSPILRGQSAQAVLYLLDGIRYNNSTYRSGNTQYLAWIPDSTVASVEALLGPAGVSYGSDALGGALNVITTSVPGFAPDATRVSGSMRVYGESTTLGAGFGGQLGVAGGSAAGFLTLSGSRHQNVRVGGARDSHHATVRYLGFSDQQVRDAFGSRLVDTSYSMAGMAAKGVAHVGGNGILTAYFVGSEQFDVRRYDRLLGGEGRVLADFDPQRLAFGYGRYERYFEDTFLQATVSVNRQTDGRRNQRRPTSALGIERNSVTSLGLETTISTTFGDHLTTAGVEAYDERVDSSEQEVRNGATTQLRPRYPDNARYTSVGAFVMDDWTALDRRLLVSAGLRYSAFRYAARAADNILDGVATVPDATQTFDDLTFNAGATYSLTEELAVWGRVARGFRAPSVFDLGEIGLTGGGFEVTPGDAIGIGAFVGDSASGSAVSTGTPWANLRPEVLWSLEGGLRYFRDDLRLEVTAFTSDFTDAISRRVVIAPDNVVGRSIGGETILGQDEVGRVYVGADPDPVVSRANIGELRVWGLEFLAQRPLSDHFLATLKASLQRGRELDTDLWARKIAPDNVAARLRWQEPGAGLWVEGVVRGAATQRRFNPGDLEDTRIGAFRDAGDIADFFNNQGPRLGLVQNGTLIATGETLDQVIARVLGPGGVGAPLFTETPGWLTFGLRASYTLSRGHDLFLAIDNITDANYRMHGSGFDGLGFNVSLSYTADF